MKLPVVSAIALLSGSVFALPSPELSRRNSTKPKIIIDNDWTSAGFIPFLQALHAGWDILGIIGDTGDTWAYSTTLHALSTLEIGNLSCIPVYKGSDYPILNTPELFQTWQQIYGELAWQGAFAAENKTKEAAGSNPTSGDPYRVSKASFVEGFPNITYVQDVSAAEFLVQTVRKYPGEVTILTAGALTNLALAQRLDPTFAQNTKKWVLMGGYIDGNLKQATEGSLMADLYNDINLKIDPEGSKMALTAPFPNITIVGNAANQVFPTEAEQKEMYEVKNPYSTLIYEQYGTTFPYWDETAAAVALHPEIVTESLEFYVDVDTSFASLSWGNIHAYDAQYKPKAQNLQKVTMVVSVDADMLKKQIKEAVQYPPTCADL